jgi:hypothetical protein
VYVLSSVDCNLTFAAIPPRIHHKFTSKNSLNSQLTRAQKTGKIHTIHYSSPMTAKCKHPIVKIVAREEDAEFVECQNCGEVFDSAEFSDIAIEEEEALAEPRGED